MRNKLRVQRLLEKVEASLRNVETKVSRTSVITQVENQFLQIQEYLGELNDLIDVEDSNN